MAHITGPVSRAIIRINVVEVILVTVGTGTSIKSMDLVEETGHLTIEEEVEEGLGFSTINPVLVTEITIAGVTREDLDQEVVKVGGATAVKMMIL